MEECLEKSNANITDACMICGENLSSAPCLKLADCNHYFHSKCALERIKTKYAGNRVTYNYLDCPGCRKEYKPSV